MLKELFIKYKVADPLFKLIYINLLVFILVQIFLTTTSLFNTHPIDDAIKFCEYWLGISSNLSDLYYKPWTLISYMFSHTYLKHILYNMAVLYFSGQIFIKYFNGKKLFLIYILGGLVGSFFYILAYYLLPVIDQSKPLIGASAAVLAILFAIATYIPNYRISIIVFGQVPIKYLAIAFVLIDIIGIQNSNAGGHIAHLGGALSGLYFSQNFKKGKDVTNVINRYIASFLDLFKKNNLKTVHKRPKTDDEFRTEKAERSVKIDAILDKIAKSGYDSLTENEKEYLFKNSKKL